MNIGAIFAPNADHIAHGLSGMYENPLNILPFQRRERPERKSPYENIDHLGRPFASPLEYLFFQPRYENEADNGTCDVVMIKPGYDKLTPGTRRKMRENQCAPFERSLYGAVDKSGLPVYDFVIREIEFNCRNGRDLSNSESDEDREIHTIMEVPHCDESS